MTNSFTTLMKNLNNMLAWMTPYYFKFLYYFAVPAVISAGKSPPLFSQFQVYSWNQGVQLLRRHSHLCSDLASQLVLNTVDMAHLQACTELQNEQLDNGLIHNINMQKLIRKSSTLQSNWKDYHPLRRFRTLLERCHLFIGLSLTLY